MLSPLQNGGLNLYWRNVYGYIKEQYIKGGQAVRIENPRVVKELEHVAKNTIVMLHRGVKFTPTQPDAVRIERIMLDELSGR